MAAPTTITVKSYIIYDIFQYLRDMLALLRTGHSCWAVLVPGVSCGLCSSDGKGQVAQGQGELALTLTLLKSFYSENPMPLRAMCMQLELAS